MAGAHLSDEPLDAEMRRAFSGVVMDVGSGAGSTLDVGSSVPVDAYQPRLLIAFDRDAPPARRGCRSVRIDFERAGLALSDASCDAAICNHVLEHVRAAPALVREIARCLRPGGVLVVSVPNGWSFSDNLYKAWKGIFRLFKGEPLPHVQRFSRRTFLDLIEGSGFEVLRISDLHETYEWLGKHPTIRAILSRATDVLRRIHRPTFIYGWHVVARRRA